MVPNLSFLGVQYGNCTEYAQTLQSNIFFYCILMNNIHNSWTNWLSSILLCPHCYLYLSNLLLLLDLPNNASFKWLVWLNNAVQDECLTSNVIQVCNKCYQICELHVNVYRYVDLNVRLWRGMNENKSTAFYFSHEYWVCDMKVLKWLRNYIICTHIWWMYCI